MSPFWLGLLLGAGGMLLLALAVAVVLWLWIQGSIDNEARW